MSNETTAKAYELRNLTADDVFPMFQIISAIGIKEFKSCFDSDAVKKAVAEAAKDGESADIGAVGMTVALDIASIIMANVPKCKESIYLFLAQLSGMTKKEIAELPMMTFVEMIIDVIKKPEFKDFFQAVSKLFK